jgi:Fe2+ or Zn2+ uptake regulation protein
MNKIKSSVYYHMLKEYRRKLSLNELTNYLKENGEKVSLSNMYREQDIMFDKMTEQGVI